MKALVVYYLRGLYFRLDEHHVFLLAGGLAFSMLICVVPMVLILFFALGSILESSTLEGQVTVLVDAVIPYKAYAEFAKDILISRARSMNNYSSVISWTVSIHSTCLNGLLRIPGIRQK